MKREASFLFFVAFVFVFSFVSAYTYRGYGSGLGYGVSQLIDIIEEIAHPLSQAIFGTTEYMFERFLFLAIVISIVYIVLSKIDIFKGDKTHEKSIRWIITISVGLLSSRFMIGLGLIEFMILNYTVLGVVLTSVIPLIIFFFFVINGFPGTSIGQSVMRKILWVFFGMVFIGVWSSRVDEIGELSWVYFGTGVVAFIMLFVDGTINRFLLKAKYGELDHQGKILKIQDIRAKLDELENRQNNPATALPEHEFKAIKRRLEKSISSLMRGL